MTGWGSTSTSGGWGSVPSPAPGGGGGGAFGLVKNLANDVKGAVEGFIPGTINLFEHPIGAAEQMGKATWSTWSPLFYGQFTKFGQGVYEHPLAPLLDLASIASLGLGTAARIGTVSDALSAESAALDAAGVSRIGEVARSLLQRRYVPHGGQLEKDMNILKQSYQPKEFQVGQTAMSPAKGIFHAAARLKLPAGRVLEDTNAGRLAAGQGLGAVTTHLSEYPLRRLLQEVVKPGMISKLPQRWQSALGQFIFTRHMYANMARRAVYTRAAQLLHTEASAQMEGAAAEGAGRMPTVDALALAGKALTDEASGTAARVRTHLAVKLHLNLIRHAPYRAPSEEAAVEFLMKHGHWRPVTAVPRGTSEDIINKLRGREAKHMAISQKYAEGASQVSKLQEQLDHANQQLSEAQSGGYLHTQTPALDSKGEPALNPTARQSMEQHAQPILEVQRNIKRLEKELETARKAKLLHDKHNELYSAMNEQRRNAEAGAFNHFYMRAGSSHEAFMKFAHSGGRILTRSFKAGDRASIERAVSQSAKGLDGTIPLVPLHDAKMLGSELAHSADWTRKNFGKATSIWKGIQVKWTTKTLTNNTVANHVLSLFLHSDPLTAFRSIYHAVRLAHGPEEANRVMMAGMPWRNKSWLMQNFQPELHNNFREGVEEDLAVRNPKQAATRLGRIFKGPGLYSLVGKVADEPVRLGGIVAYMHHHPEVMHEADRIMAKASKDGVRVDRTAALDRASKRVLQRDPNVRNAAAAFGRTIAGDYLATTPAERGIKDWIPFYLWDRHIAKSGTNILLNTPIRAALIQQMSNQGADEAKKFLGQLPDFLQGAVPLQMLGMSGGSGGRMNAIVGPSLNPFGTLGEIAGALQGATVGGDTSSAEDILGQLNPLLTDTLSAVAGRNLMTGSAEHDVGGAIPTMFSNIFQGFPEEKIIQSAIQGPQTTTTTASGKTFPKLYSQNELAAISNFLGVPIKQISPSTAQYLAKRQQPKRKKIGAWG